MATVGLAAATLCLAALLTPLATAAVARHRAAAAADAAALAAAAASAGLVAAPDGAPCGLAAVLAERHGAVLRGCRIEPGSATVEVAVGTAFGPLVVRATAGDPGEA